MDSPKKINYDKFLPVIFVVLLVLTIVFHRQAFGQDKEAMGTSVSVKVTDVRTNSTGLNPGGLDVTVTYQGKTYKLQGVPSGAHFVMENSMKYQSTIDAKLYKGKLYYDSTSIRTLSDKIYFAFLVATFFVFVLMFGKRAGIIS